MEHQALIAKLEQIQQHAQAVLNEYPRVLTEERLRFIIALARQLRAELELEGAFQPSSPSAEEDDAGFRGA